jgi:hypothetical protein
MNTENEEVRRHQMKRIILACVLLSFAGLAASPASASNFRQTVTRTTGYSTTPPAPSEGQSVPIYYSEWQYPGCPTPHQTFLYLGINGSWSVKEMPLIENPCAPFNSSGAATYLYTVPPQPAGTVVEYVVNVPTTPAQWLKAGSNLAFNEWNTGYSYFGNYQNFMYTVQGFIFNTSHWPPNGQIRSTDDLWINTETYPTGVCTRARVVYSTDDVNWFSKDMDKAGQTGNNDWWHVNLGKFPAGATVRYAVEAVGDNDVSRWDNNNGNDYRATVNPAAPIYWAGNVWHWPPSGQITAQTDFWVNIESWPKGAATYARVVYSTDGGATWNSRDLELGGQVGNNDWWHLNLGTFPSRTTIRYAIEVRDGTGKSIWANNNGADYYATVK